MGLVLIAAPKLVAPLWKVVRWSRSVGGGNTLTFRVTAKAATPSCRHASVLSELGRLPKLDHVVPSLVLIQKGVTRSFPDRALLNAPEIIMFGLSGSTARLGSEFWPISPLAAFGMTSMTGITRAFAGTVADSSAITDAAHTPDSNPGRAIDSRLDRRKFCMIPSASL